MRKLLTTALVVAVAISLTASSSNASREVTVKPVDSSQPTPIGGGPGVANALTCQVGNLNPAAWAITNLIGPGVAYKLAFDPKATCSACPIAIDINSITIQLQTAGACDIVMSVDVEEADYPNDPNCPEPGTEHCTSSLYTVSLPGAGGWLVNLPIDCVCLPVDRIYLLSVHFESTTCDPVPALVTSASANLCTNWNNLGTGWGWYDLLVQFPNWPGDLRIYADADCCSAPVPVEKRTWGAIRSLYQN